MARHKKWLPVAFVGIFALGVTPAMSQQRSAQPARGGDSPARSTGASPSRPAAQPSTNAPQNRVRNTVRTQTRSVRAPSGGVRAPSGGVRAPRGGVRAPSGGVRAPGAGQRPIVVQQPSRPGDPGGPGNPGNPGGPGGWDPGHGNGGDCKHHGSCTCVLLPWYGYGWWGYSYRSRWYAAPQWGVWGPENRELEVQTQPEPEPPTAYETARAWMEAGEAEAAVSWYQAHLDENPTDLEAMREYAAALLEADRFADAVAMMGYVYDLAPGQANRAMDPGLWGGSPLRLRRSVVSAVRFAQRSPSGNAWLLVAVLMQAEGRDGVALRMVDRASDEGLDSAVADRMRARLARR